MRQEFFNLKINTSGQRLYDFTKESINIKFKHSTYKRFFNSPRKC